MKPTPPLRILTACSKAADGDEHPIGQALGATPWPQPLACPM